MRDFTNCKTFKKTYGGANGNKICAEIDGERYMIKFPSKPSKNPELSYTNGCVSEHLACSIFNSMGISTQETMLGTYNVNGKEKLVVACKDMAINGYQLHDFASLKNSVIDSVSNGYGTELSDILDVIEYQTYLDPMELKTHFCEMFVADSFLGNFDRHNGNWGFLYNEQTDDFKIAPVYDCGSCLYPQADENLINKILSDENEINNRVYTFPTSAIKEDGRKINYYDFLTTTDDPDFLNAIVNIHDRINLNDIHNIVNNTEYITDIQKTFYNTMISERYEKIIEPAYEIALEKIFEYNQCIENYDNTEDLEEDEDIEL